MWCNNCNIETNDSICPLCGAQTIEDLTWKYIGATIVTRQ